MFGFSFNVPSAAEGHLRTILSQTDYCPTFSWLHYTTVQFRMMSTPSRENSQLCAPLRQSEIMFPQSSLSNSSSVVRIDVDLFSSFGLMMAFSRPSGIDDGLFSSFGLMMAFSRPFEEDSRALPLSAPLYPPGDRYCDVLGFEPSVSVSSSSTVEIF